MYTKIGASLIGVALSTLLITGCGGEPETNPPSPGGVANQETEPTPTGDCAPEEMFGDVCFVGTTELVADLVPNESQRDGVKWIYGASMDPGIVLGDKLLFHGGAPLSLHATDGTEVWSLTDKELDAVSVIGDRAVLWESRRSQAIWGTDGVTVQALPTSIPNFDEYVASSTATFEDGVLLSAKSEEETEFGSRTSHTIVRTDGTPAGTEVDPFEEMKSIESSWRLLDGTWAIIGKDSEGLERLWLLESATGTPLRADLGDRRISHFVGEYDAGLLVEAVFDDEKLVVNPKTGALEYVLDKTSGGFDYPMQILNPGRGGSHMFTYEKFNGWSITDGTEAGTTTFDDEGFMGNGLTMVGDYALTTSERGLLSLGKQGAVTLVDKLNARSLGMYAFGERLVFWESHDDSEKRMWVTDGTKEGTHLLSDGEDYRAWPEVGGELWIWARDEDTRDIQVKTLASDATQTTTLFAEDGWVGGNVSNVTLLSEEVGPAGGIFVRLTIGGTDTVVWTDGARVEPLANTRAGAQSSIGDTPVWFADAWYLIGRDNDSGPELWRWLR